MYSQNKEEQVILGYFGGHIGTFLDCGSNDGITFSNVRALAERGWQGVFVEASPKAYERLKENYKGLKGFYMYNCALAGHNGQIMLQESGALIGKDDIALVSTAVPAEMERFKKVVDYTPVKVPCYRWRTFLNRLTIKEFDFISIDIEGLDAVVLSQIDLTNVKCVCVEWNSIPANKKEFERLLKGFRLIYTSGENLIYAR